MYCVRLCLGKRLFHVTLTPREYFLFLGYGLTLVSKKGCISVVVNTVFHGEKKANIPER